MLELTLQHILNGLVVGSAYALIAIGLTMIFGLMDIANFAHGEFYMLGGFFAYYAVSFLGLSFFVTIPLAIVVTMAVGALLDRGVFRRLRGTPLMSSVLATIGLSIFFQHVALLVWGPQPNEIPTPFPPASIHLGPLFITPFRLFIAGVTLLLILAAHGVLQYTRVGKATRAVFQNRESAALVGIDIDRIYLLSFTFGSGLAAAAGVLLGPIFLVYPTMGGMATLKAFIVVIVGGMGNFLGAIVSGLLLGVAESLGAGFVSTAYKDAVGFVIVIIVLMLMPQGLFGSKA
ncbi:MAG: branched-chain amino acid ABC transporter permease [Deltaproteobacteria bacterium]|nr:branched-chain amino acid ABC transporter permease [Deltaproteobacteria bacterium]MBI3079510.1 branched-chain amino acid ABC transporter permease [Deltaproteobacteria bacterium]